MHLYICQSPPVGVFMRDFEVVRYKQCCPPLSAGGGELQRQKRPVFVTGALVVNYPVFGEQHLFHFKKTSEGTTEMGRLAT